MRFLRSSGGTYDTPRLGVLKPGTPTQVQARDGKLYISSSTGLVVVDIPEDTASFYGLDGVHSYNGNLFTRNEASGFGYASSPIYTNRGLDSLNVKDIMLSEVGPDYYTVLTTSSGVEVLRGDRTHFTLLSSADDYTAIAISRSGGM